MKIAVTYKNGQVFQHFGHTEQFKLYDTKGTSIKNTEIIETNGSGHGALANFLAEKQVEALICGGIGMGAMQALEGAGIQLVGGASGDADTQVTAFLKGELSHDPSAKCNHHHENAAHECSHHEHGHSCGHC